LTGQGRSSWSGSITRQSCFWCSWQSCGFNYHSGNGRLFLGQRGGFEDSDRRQAGMGCNGAEISCYRSGGGGAGKAGGEELLMILGHGLLELVHC
jgi:hypothetical protein